MRHNTPFSFQIRRLRGERGYTQEQLSQLSGVPRSSIARIEGGRFPDIRSSTLQSLADALSVKPGVLLEAPHKRGARR